MTSTDGLGPLTLRPARAQDAGAMCRLINPIIAEGRTTAHRTPFDPERMVARYIAPPRRVCCTTARDAHRLVGFQMLESPDPDWTGWGAVPDDWGLIASFVAGDAQGRGVGRAMFAVTLAAARAAGMAAIDATIRADNAPGLAFYGALGFVAYDRVEGVPLSDGTVVDRIRKRYAISPQT